MFQYISTVVSCNYIGGFIPDAPIILIGYGDT